jgi:PKD repeat protein
MLSVLPLSCDHTLIQLDARCLYPASIGGCTGKSRVWPNSEENKMNQRVFRTFVSLLLAFVFTFSGSNPVLAAPPDNDNFASAQNITAFPFNTTVDLTEATSEPGEVPYCELMDKSVWYSFTATENTLLQAEIQGALDMGNLNIYQVYQPNAGMDGLFFKNCAGLDHPYKFVALAGETYYFQIGTSADIDGSITVNFQQLPPPANDNFADAISINSIPFTADFDASGGTQETGEPAPSCAEYIYPPHTTIWYVYHATVNGSLSANMAFSLTTFPWIAVYNGTDLSNLNELDCEQGNNSALTFQTVAGQTYYIQIGNYFEEISALSFTLDMTPPPVADFVFYMNNSAINDPIQFYENSYDPANVEIVAWDWDFGDGTTATGPSAVHSYTADGDFPVTLTVTTLDGRSASATKIMEIRTYDVSVTKVEAPKSGSAGRSQEITVSIRNVAYPTTVRLELYKSLGGGEFESIGMFLQYVPVRPGNRTSQYTFSYIFSAQDAVAGTVTFKAIAYLEGAVDTISTDNEMISSPPTTVKP